MDKTYQIHRILFFGIVFCYAKMRRETEKLRKICFAKLNVSSRAFAQLPRESFHESKKNSIHIIKLDFLFLLACPLRWRGFVIRAIY